MSLVTFLFRIHFSLFSQEVSVNECPEILPQSIIFPVTADIAIKEEKILVTDEMTIKEEKIPVTDEMNIKDEKILVTEEITIKEEKIDITQDNSDLTEFLV